jgi:hypothetical protein
MIARVAFKRRVAAKSRRRANEQRAQSVSDASAEKRAALFAARRIEEALERNSTP